MIPGAALILCALAAVSTTATVEADRDATLFEESGGGLASGAGTAIFAGRTNSVDPVRRGLIHFTLPSRPPTKRPTPVAIDGVAVVLTNTTQSNVSPREYRLHRVLADWGEGTSSSSGGSGAASTAGDATWIHAFYPDVYWMHNGAQFEGEPSARLVVEGPGVYRFEGDGLLLDVKRWAQDPSTNFGWILIGDETQPQTARAFASREHPNATFRPVLEVHYRTVP